MSSRVGRIAAHLTEWQISQSEQYTGQGERYVTHDEQRSGQGVGGPTNRVPPTLVPPTVSYPCPADPRTSPPVSLGCCTCRLQPPAEVRRLAVPLQGAQAGGHGAFVPPALPAAAVSLCSGLCSFHASVFAVPGRAMPGRARPGQAAPCPIPPTVPISHASLFSCFLASLSLSLSLSVCLCPLPVCRRGACAH